MRMASLSSPQPPQNTPSIDKFFMAVPHAAVGAVAGDDGIEGEGSERSANASLDEREEEFTNNSEDERSQRSMSAILDAGSEGDASTDARTSGDVRPAAIPQCTPKCPAVLPLGCKNQYHFEMNYPHFVEVLHLERNFYPAEKLSGAHHKRCTGLAVWNAADQEWVSCKECQKLVNPSCKVAVEYQRNYETGMAAKESPRLSGWD